MIHPDEWRRRQYSTCRHHRKYWWGNTILTFIGATTAAPKWRQDAGICLRRVTWEYACLTTMLKYNLRGVIRRVQEFLKMNNNLYLIARGINDALLRVSEPCKSEYASIQGRFRKSKWVYIDETGFHFDGNKYWVWFLRSADSDILVVITDSRGGMLLRSSWSMISTVLPTLTDRKHIHTSP